MTKLMQDMQKIFEAANKMAEQELKTLKAVQDRQDSTSDRTDFTSKNAQGQGHALQS